ncbi:MAG: hypothetical protein HKO02_11690 [Hyphomonadaceae bacterium]|nr:hypothetical protein [Hyphomonadaceae bacterium]
MSKRHRKSKDMLAAFSGDYEDMQSFAFDLYQAPRGQKPKGKQKRQTLKRAYYDD